MRANELPVDARRAGLAWAVGVLDAAGRFRVTLRRRALAPDTPTDLIVEVACYDDVGHALINVFGGVWVPGRESDWRGRWQLRQHEIADVLEVAIPLMRNARAVQSAQAVLGVRMTKGRPGPQVSDAVRAARREAAGIVGGIV